MFDAQVRYLHSHFGYSAEEVDLPTFPLFALFDAALGMTAVIPEMDFSRPGAVDPRKIIEPIGDHAVTHMFGQLLAEHILEFRFVVPQVVLAGPTAHKQIDHTLGLGLVVNPFVARYSAGRFVTQ